MKDKITKRYEKTISGCICKLRNVKLLLKSGVNIIANESELNHLSKVLRELRNEYNYLRFANMSSNTNVPVRTIERVNVIIGHAVHQIKEDDKLKKYFDCNEADLKSLEVFRKKLLKQLLTTF